MKAEIKKLFEQLNAYWFMSGTGYEGENPGCYELQLQILNEIKQMEVVDAVKLINELSDSQINQIIVIVEEIIDAHPQTVHSFRMINNERNIYWLNDELRLLGFVEKV
jgi:hypothetical protein